MSEQTVPFAQKKEINLTIEGDIQKLNIAPGDSLVIRLISPEIDRHHLDALSEGLKAKFPHNKILIMSLMEGLIELSVIKEPLVLTNTCTGCSCSKKY